MQERKPEIIETNKKNLFVCIFSARNVHNLKLNTSPLSACTWPLVTGAGCNSPFLQCCSLCRAHNNLHCSAVLTKSLRLLCYAFDVISCQQKTTTDQGTKSSAFEQKNYEFWTHLLKSYPLHKKTCKTCALCIWLCNLCHQNKMSVNVSLKTPFISNKSPNLAVVHSTSGILRFQVRR